MNKLRQLEIVGFRGARFSLPIDFTTANKSISIYGENAAGKSTTTDAIEWFLFNRIAHLWIEDCKEHALRNVLLGDDDVCAVSLRFDNSSLDGTKSLAANLQISVSTQTQNARTFLATVQDDRIFLRHAQITKFIAATKNKKREEIASIIGYEELLNFRDILRSTTTQLRKDNGYTAAKHFAEAAKNKLFKLTNSIIATETDLFKKATESAATLGLGLTVKDNASYELVIETLHGKITKPESAEKQLKLEQLKKDCDELISVIQQLPKVKDDFLKPYNVLAKNKTAMSQLSIEQFLSQGQKIIEEKHFEEDKCPFCLTPSNLQRLKEEVEKRISEIENLKTSYDALAELKDHFNAVVTSIGILCRRLAENYSDSDAATPLALKALAVLPALRSWITNSKAAYDNFESISINAQDVEQVLSVESAARSAVESAIKGIEALQLSKNEQAILQSIDMLRELRGQFREFEKHTKSIEACETQILSLSSMLEAFKAVQSAALQSVLDEISKDVGAYYAMLHPKENVDQVRLRVIGDEGIEFEYNFHGKATYPPMKYLSESHLNSLGICLFLASAKLLNKASKFLVLDDIVTSFDLGHRRRLLRLLKDQFSDWQIILLTHEHLWYEMIRRELGSSGWLFSEVNWDPDNGIQIAPTAADWNALIAEKRKKYDVSNDIRKLLESNLKEIALALEVGVPFRFNDDNEHRMSGELLSALRSTTNEKSPQLKGHPIFSQLEGSNLVATVGSHDNPGETITGGDIDVALSDIDTLVGLFSCPDCKRYVEAKRQVAGHKQISCRCGKKTLDWKS